jgi:Tol biopolymer transport system component
VKENKHMKTKLTKLICAVVSVIGLATGAVTANAGPGDLFASMKANGQGPDLVFRNSGGGLSVVNEDGSGSTQILRSGPEPEWGPGGSGTQADPYKLVYEPSSGVIGLADVYLDSRGKPVARNISTISAAFGAFWPTYSPAGDRVAFVESRPNNYATISSIATNGSNEIEHYAAPVGSTLFDPVYSPDGSKIAFIEYTIGNPSTASVKEVDMLGNVTPLVPPGSFNGIWSIDLSSNQKLGMEISDGNNHYKVYTLDLSTPGANPVYIADGEGVAFSPDGSKIAYTGLNGKNLYVFDGSSSRLILRGFVDDPDWR